MIKKICISILLFSIGAGLMAQRPGGGQKRDFSNMPAEGIVIGKVTDAISGTPMEYANVVLYSLRDSSMVAGTVTGVDGVFRMEKVPYGKHYLVAHFMGYVKLQKDGIMINPRKKAFDVGEISLEPTAENLEAVEITVSRQ